MQTPSSHSLSANMPKVNYSLDNSIAAFFSSSETFAARAQCDETVRREIGGPVYPVSLRGIGSAYTVRQARVGWSSSGSWETRWMRRLCLWMGRRTRVVLRTMSRAGLLEDRRGMLGRRRLSVYSLSSLPGTNHILIRADLAESLPLHGAPVKSLARCVDTARLFAPRLV